MLLNDATNTKSIVTNGLGLQAQRFSPLKQIDKANVKGLAPAWSFSFGGEKQRGQESQALVHDGVIYVTGSYSRLYAIDAKTGDKKWEYDARLPEGILPCCDVVNRGPALYGDLVYFGTLDAQFVALNAKTGKLAWKKEIEDFKGGYSMTAAPLIVPTQSHGALILTGVSGGEFGVVGRVEARKASTGDLVWTRPVLEGLMGRRQGHHDDRQGQRKLAGRHVQVRRRRALARRRLRSRDQARLLRHRQSGSVELLAATGRQQVDIVPPRHRPGNRRDQVGLPDHAA